MRSAGLLLSTAALARASYWAGSILSADNAHYASAKVQVPTPSIPQGGNDQTSYAGSAWVGIGGVNCGLLLQTGITWSIQGSQITYTGWTEYVGYTGSEGGGSTSENFELAAGDEITMTINADNLQTFLYNARTNQVVVHTYENQPLTCRGTAEWIVEDFFAPGEVPFAAFSEVSFLDLQGTDANGNMDFHNGQPQNIVNSNGQLVAQGSIDYYGNVNVKYELNN